MIPVLLERCRFYLKIISRASWLGQAAKRGLSILPRQKAGRTSRWDASPLRKNNSSDEQGFYYISGIYIQQHRRTYLQRKIQKERAQSVSQLADSYCIAIGLLEHFMPDKDVESSADAEHLLGIKKPCASHIVFICSCVH